MTLDRALLAPNAVRDWGRATPDAVFLQHVSGDTLSYAQVDARLDGWASALRAAAVQPGEHVASFVTSPVDAAVVWLALGRGGHLAVPLNTAHVGSMLRHVLATSDAVALIVSSDLVDRLAAVIGDLPMLRLVVVLGDATLPDLGIDTVSAADLLDRAETTADAAVDHAGPEPHETAMLLFTSGTTGASKAVIVPWAGAYGYWSWVPADTLAAGDGLYAPMTMFHISGLGALQYAASKGARFIVRDRFSASEFWTDVRTTEATTCGIVGPMTALLASAPERDDDADNPLRNLLLGPMIEGMEAFERRFGVRVATCYGMTEVPPIIATGWDHGPWQSCGSVLAGFPWAEARVVDTFDHEVPNGEVGELIVRTAEPWTLNGGYYRNPEATVAAWRNGWFHTGDAFRRDDEGRFYFVDRINDTIRRRGENISSFEVESAVLEHDGVEACAAYGVPDMHGGHEVMIAVVPKAGAAIDVAGLGADLAARMPRYMVPRYIDIVADLPRNTTSLRVQKFALRERGITPTTWDRLGDAASG